MRFQLALVFVLSAPGFYAQLFINEISQGTGSKEYIELVVVGNQTCATPAPCIDLRGIVLDDNNGDFASGSGQGIAQGALRFANIPFWSCISQGTMIVIYNENDINSSIPPDDLSMTDGNCRLIIPANSNLLEGQSTSPTTSVNTYPNLGWLAGGGSWSQVAMANSGDSFQIRANSNSTNASHAVSWGGNSNNTIIFFSGSSSNTVYSFTNNTNNNPALQANWTSGNVGVNETPGAANNTANSLWISSMNPQCGISNSIQVSASSTPTGCGSGCTGTAMVNVTGGNAPYTYLWSNGSTSQNLNSLCAGTYTVTVTDASGCSMDAQTTVALTGSNLSVQVTVINETCQGACDGSISATISGGTAPYTILWSNGSTNQNTIDLCPNTYTIQVSDGNGCTGNAQGIVLPGTAVIDATILTNGPFSTTDSPVQFTSVTSGGTWSSDCGSCLTASGLFDPQISGEGNFQICYTTGSGSCTNQDCNTIVVTGCTPQNTNSTEIICPGDSLIYNGQQLFVAGNYTTTLPGVDGCDSTHTLNLQLYTVTPSFTILTPCQGDSIFLQNSWYYTSDNIVENVLDQNGCTTTHTTQLIFENCAVDDYAVFIPNVFTPNNDNTNDYFFISMQGAMLLDGFIVNRWGNILKEFHNDDLIWDGKDALGQLVPDGVYTYLIRVEKSTGGREEIHGFVTVLK